MPVISLIGRFNMSEYLSKEEVRRWRSSLERITLEEYAVRLGKKIQEEKETRDIVDLVMPKSTLKTYNLENYNTTGEKITHLYNKSTEIENKIQSKQVNKLKNETKQTKTQSSVTIKEQENKPEDIDLTNLNISFKKALTPREQAVFDYFVSNRNSVIYAKDLAKLLDLPRDYVYKYIKNLRNKLNENIIFNSDNGGFVVKF